MIKITILVSLFISISLALGIKSILDYYSKKTAPFDFAKNTNLRHMAKKKDSRGLDLFVNVISYGGSLLDVDESYWSMMDRKLIHMGISENSKYYLTKKFIESLIIALPCLLMPFMFHAPFLIICFFAMVAVTFASNLKQIDKDYTKWQQKLINEIPEVIDRLSICFAGGKSYQLALTEAKKDTKSQMSNALEVLLEDIRTKGVRKALAIFSQSFDLPATTRLATAISIAVESGYEQAEIYLMNIEDEMRELRRNSAMELIKGKPEKIKYLYGILFGLSVAALILKGIEITNQLSIMFS